MQEYTGHYQLKFDKPQAEYSCINYDMMVEKNLTVAENLVDTPSKEKILGFHKGNVKLLDQTYL
jgi:hypothetical protein